jgi:hypothetical protein
MLPRVPRDRGRAADAAFLKTLKDPEFVAESDKTRMTLTPIPGTTFKNDRRRPVHRRGLKEKVKPILVSKVNSRIGRHFGIRAVDREVFSGPRNSRERRQKLRSNLLAPETSCPRPVDASRGRSMLASGGGTTGSILIVADPALFM